MSQITVKHMEFIFHSGYLTLGKKIEDDGMCYLKIPNEEILKMFSEMFIEIYFEDYEKFCICQML